MLTHSTTKSKSESESGKDKGKEKGKEKGTGKGTGKAKGREREYKSKGNFISKPLGPDRKIRKLFRARSFRQS
jgi:hypothetical protein